ncbi:MAG: hypothetical protein GX811_00745, partial [Lentisphaerae bacterium]|nr:hypothetical protein [Lentisphaerota bacterium]
MKILKSRKMTALLCALLIVGGAFSASNDKKNKEPTPEEKELLELCDNIQKGKPGVNERDLERLINLAKKLGKPFAAAAASRNYATAHPDISPNMQLLTAENSMLAGDFRNAVSRYKSFLNTAVPGPQASDVAAGMYVSQIDFLDAAGDAYDFMKLAGDKYRVSDSAKKFDHWYLSRLQRTGDLANYTDRLISVFQEKMPQEKEEYFYREYLEWLMTSIKRPGNAHFAITDKVKTLTELVRTDNVTKLRYNFYLSYLSYAAQAVGKSAADVEKLFEPVSVTAKTYFDASPSMQALDDILEVFSSNFNVGVWNVLKDKKEAFFVYAFGKLKGEEKVKFLQYPASRIRFLATNETWHKLLTADPKSFADASSFQVPEAKVDVFAKQAQHMPAQRTEYAATARSIAAGKDLKSAVNHFVDNESWYIPFNRTYRLVETNIWPVYKVSAAEPLQAVHFNTFLSDFGQTKLMTTPLPLFDTLFVANSLFSAWREGDKSQFASFLNTFEWIPYTPEQAKTVFEPAYKDFVAWTG